MADDFALDPAEYGVTVAHGGPAQDAALLDPGGPAAVPPPQLGILSRAWNSVKDIGNEVVNPTPYVAEGPPGIGKQLGEGFVQGVSDVAGPPTTWMLRQLGVGDTATKAVADRKQQFEEQFGDSTPASIGRAAGQTVATAPVLGAGGVAARAAAAAVPALAPAVTFLGGGARLAPTANLAARTGTRAASLAAQGAVAGGVQGALTDQGALEGAATGAVAGPVIGAATYPLRAAVGRVANMVNPIEAEWAQRAGQYGLDIDPVRMTNNPSLRIAGDQLAKLPFSGVDPLAPRRQWQAAVAREFGETTTDGIDDAVMDRAQRRIRGVMDAVVNRTTVQADPGLYRDMARIGSDMGTYGLSDTQTRNLQAQAQNVLRAFSNGGGRISGDAYQNLVQTGGPLHTAISSDDPTIAQFGGRIRDALEGAFYRSAAPGDQAALTEARQQYRALKTVQPLVEQHGAGGDVNPNALQTQVIAQSRRFDPSTGGYAYTGGGALGDLAHIGKMFYAPQPESGTAVRNLVVGAMGGGALANPMIPAKIAAGLMANYLLQLGIRSPAVGRAMIEGTLNPASRGAQFSNRALVPAAVGLLNNYTPPP